MTESDTPDLLDKNRKSPRFHILIAALVAVLGFVMFSPALNYEFIYDDHVDVRQVDNVFTPGAWPELFTTTSARLYRPFKYLSYYLDNKLFGWDSKGFHLTNCLLHAAICALLYGVLLRMRITWMGAGLAALFFAIHPTHTEVVAWVSTRASLLSTLAVLGMAWFYMGWRRDGRKSDLLGLALCGFLGFFSKEDALMILPLLVAMEWLLNPGGLRLRNLLRRPFVVPVVILSVIAVSYVGIRQSLISGLEQGDGAGLLSVLASLPVLMIRYFGLTLFPAGMSIDQYVDYESGFGLKFWLCLLALLPILAVFFIRRPEMNKWKFAIAWFFIFMFPVMGLIPINQPFADRFLYLPGIAFCIAIGFGWDALAHRSPATRKGFATAYGVLLGIFFIMTVSYLPVWRNEFSLWEHTVQVNPQSYRGYTNLAHIANNQGQYQDALPLVERSLEIKPDFYDGMVVKGFTLQSLGKPVEAERLYRAAVTKDPENTVWLKLLADLLRHHGKPAEAGTIYEAIFALRPGYVEARVDAGFLAATQGDFAKAEEHWMIALKFSPGHPLATRNLEVLAAQRKEKARKKGDQPIVTPTSIAP
ncbi:MAG: tetratricopeptide repeat protein [Roseibacillus sp.]|jgi:hypothetical protein